MAAAISYHVIPVCTAQLQEWPVITRVCGTRTPRRHQHPLRQTHARNLSVLAATPQQQAPQQAAGRKLTSTELRENVNKASKLIDEMLEEIMRDLFIDQATSFLTEEQPEMAEAQAIRNTVIQRIEFLDANFLASLNGYIQVAGSRNEAGLAEMLETIRDEVLRQVALRLPPAARVMDVALMHQDKSQRLRVLRTVLHPGTSAASGPGASRDADSRAPEPGPAGSSQPADAELAALPTGVDSDMLLSAATHMIDEMEEHQVIPDRRLLARMCLVREEVRWLEHEMSFRPTTPPAAEADLGDGSRASRERVTAARFARKNVPQRCVAFLKELLVVNDSQQRVALLSKALSNDWDGAAPRQKLQRKDSKLQDHDQPDYVRPGRFMSTLHSMTRQLEEARMGTETESTPRIDPEQHARVTRRLADIHSEVMGVLDCIQRGEVA